MVFSCFLDFLHHCHLLCLHAINLLFEVKDFLLLLIEVLRHLDLIQLLLLQLLELVLKFDFLLLELIFDLILLGISSAFLESFLLCSFKSLQFFIHLFDLIMIFFFHRI